MRTRVRTAAAGGGLGLGSWLIQWMMPEPSPWLTYPLWWLALTLIIFAGLDWWGEIRQPADRSRRISAWDALSYVENESMWKFNEYWENFSRGGLDWLMSSPGIRAFLLDGRLLPAFERAAKNGDIDISGRLQHTSDYLDIPASFWETNQIDRSAYNGRGSNLGGADGGKTQPKITGVRLEPIYVGLRVIDQQVKKMWPPMSKTDRLVLANMGTVHG